MRRPTPVDVLYSWHTVALENPRHPVDADDPQCGWFKFRWVRGGPWIPVRIWCRQIIDRETGDLAEPEVLIASVGIDEEPRALGLIWSKCCGTPITEDEWLVLVHAPDRAIMEATHAPVDLSKKPMRPA